MGRATAIRQVAMGRNAWPLGVLLVLITTIPRNYDQTWIGEDLLRWCLGSLGFSLISGTLVFGLIHGMFLRWRRDPALPAVRFGAQWIAFMGVFWLTAPVAWLYAIPVERFLDPLAATRANLVLLGVVSLWRVALMARAIRVLTGAPVFASAVWVLVPATIEVLGVMIFGGTFAKRIMAGMGGMRNSPKEELLLEAFSTVSNVALFGLPVVTIIGLSLLDRTPPTLRPLARPGIVRTPWVPLAACLGIWLTAAVPAQRQVRRNAALESLMEAGDNRAALDYLAAHQPGDFAPARTLAPNAFEWPVFAQLPALLDLIQPTDPDWVQDHLLRRLDQMVTHLNGQRRRRNRDTEADPEVVRELYRGAINSMDRQLDAQAWTQILDSLDRLPRGREWIDDNPLLLGGLADAALEPRTGSSPRQTGDWNGVLERLERLGIHPVPPAVTAPPTPPTPRP